MGRDIAFMAIWGVVLVMVISALTLAFNSATCNQFSEMNPTIETQFRFLGGCYAKIDGLWIPTGQLRGVQ